MSSLPQLQTKEYTSALPLYSNKMRTLDSETFNYKWIIKSIKMLLSIAIILKQPGFFSEVFSKCLKLIHQILWSQSLLNNPDTHNLIKLNTQKLFYIPIFILLKL